MRQAARRVMWLVLVLAAIALPARAQQFSADEFFGQGVFAPDADDPARGKLSMPLAGQPLADFIDLSRSGAGRVADCIVQTATGMLMQPAEGESCEAELDVAFTSAVASIEVVEIDRGATLQWHVTGRGQNAAHYLAELEHLANGTLNLRLKTRNAQRWIQMPDANVSFAEPAWPQVLKLTLSADRIVVSVAGSSTSARTELAHGEALAIAASDGRVRVSKLCIEGTLEPGWMDEAAVRLQARRTLARLREYATFGLLRGIAATELPQSAADLAKYSADEQKKRAQALADNNYSARRDALLALAAAHADVALARHEAGVAALLAGDPVTGASELEAAEKLAAAPVTRLALAEAYRRLRRFDDADKLLAQAKSGLPQSLNPDFELLRGRLAAARGDFTGASDILGAAARKWPDNQQLGDFAQSAEELAASASLVELKIAGPLGLKVSSDMPEADVQNLLKRLKPYIDSYRVWLPKLAGSIEGTIAIYETPEEYLRAALLVAADNLDNVAGMFLPQGAGGRRRVIACRAFGEDELVRTLAHELWHLAYSTLPAAASAPAWLNEGMAVYLASGFVNADGVLSFRSLPSEFSDMQPGLKAALDEVEVVSGVLAAARGTFYLPEHLRSNYAVAWSLVWYYAEKDSGTAGALRLWLAGDAGALEKLKADLKTVLPLARQSLAAWLK